MPRWVCFSFLGSRRSRILMDSARVGEKKFAELELSLLHLQQNVEITETHLAIHPTIQRAVEQVCRRCYKYDDDQQMHLLGSGSWNAF